MNPNPITPTPDATGKVLMTQEQWEEVQRDKARLDWMSQMQVDCEGRILTRVFMPSERTLRQAIDSAMSADTKGT